MIVGWTQVVNTYRFNNIHTTRQLAFVTHGFVVIIIKINFSSAAI